MEPMIRPAVVAGSWYPGDPNELARTVDGYMGEVRPVDGEPIALVVPHAGYVFSGPIAAHGFRQLQGLPYEVAVVIASDHAPPISRPISVWAQGGFETPLGIVAVDERVAQSLLDADHRISFDPATHEGEHPIEIELPYLQRACPECRIVPILMGSDDQTSIVVLANALIDALAGRKAVIIASSDLSHYPTYEDAMWVDRMTIGAVETGDQSRLRDTIADLMLKGIPGLATCACGEAPIRVAMLVAEGLGADTYRMLHYANSGDSAFGDRTRVVGYGALMFWRHEPLMLSQSQRSTLVDLARQAIEERVRSGELSDFETDQQELNRLAAAFVTVKIQGTLRGCIGYLRHDTPLHQVVRDKAVAAATMDPRFPPLTEEELELIDIEISILSPLRRLASPEQIEIGTHGLVIMHEGRQGVLLPQVAAERGWDRETFLDHLCVKAGLPERSWLEGAALYAFTTVEFGDRASG